MSLQCTQVLNSVRKTPALWQPAGHPLGLLSLLGRSQQSPQRIWLLQTVFYSVHAQSLAHRLISLEHLGTVAEGMTNKHNKTVINILMNQFTPSSVEHFSCINSKAVRKKHLCPYRLIITAHLAARVNEHWTLFENPFDPTLAFTQQFFVF